MEAAETKDRPLSSYEELSLDDGDSTRTDPWSETPARFSTASSSFQTSPSRSSPGMSPPSKPVLDRYDSIASVGTSLGRTTDEVPLVLGVAVVDFNHLVSRLNRTNRTAVP